MKSGPNALAMVEKRVLFRSISGPMSTLQPSQNQESSSSSSKDIIVTDLIGSAEERQSAPKSKSFTYGCAEREEIKQRLSVDEQDFEHPLLVRCLTGTNMLYRTHSLSIAVPAS